MSCEESRGAQGVEPALSRGGVVSLREGPRDHMFDGVQFEKDEVVPDVVGAAAAVVSEIEADGIEPCEFEVMRSYEKSTKVACTGESLPGIRISAVGHFSL